MQRQVGSSGGSDGAQDRWCSRCCHAAMECVDRKSNADIGADTDAGVLVHLGAVAPGQRFGTVLMVAIMTSATISG